MLNDETPRFSMADVWKMGSLIVIGTLAYSNLQQVQTTDRDRTTARLDKIQSEVETLQVAALPDRINRIEYILCATEDAARTRACERLGVLK